MVQQGGLLTTAGPYPLVTAVRHWPMASPLLVVQSCLFFRSNGVFRVP